VTDVLVLCYHAVSPTWDADLSVTPEALETQLALFAQAGWRGTTFTEAVLRPRFPRTLAVTFDDGFLSVLELAQPILDRLGFPATVFIPTRFMSERQPLAWPGTDHWLQTPFASEMRGMSWDDLRALASNGWEIGSHTQSHARLTQLDDDRARAELDESRRACEEHLDAPCTSVAYPYGDEDQRVAEMAASAGYAAGARLSSDLVPGGPLRWPRVGIYHPDVAWRFRLKASGAMRRTRASRLWPALERRLRSAR
jgi:peptidoglycan/xylan/chitin deacetylase (PgdA/CDA1 family)